MAVPRDTRVAVVPREVLTPRATRVVVEVPARREDPIPRDIRDLAPNLDRIAVPKEAVMVPREGPNLDLDHMMDTLEVAMGEMTAVDRNAERTVSSKATLQAFAIRDNAKFT